MARFGDRVADLGPAHIDQQHQWQSSISDTTAFNSGRGWFGADAQMLARVLPNLGAFSPATLGFLRVVVGGTPSLCE
jgi:hypothetical protein